MTTLLTFSQQQTHKPITLNNESKFDLLAYEVENSELLDLLGIELLQDLQDNPTTADNVKLLDGCSFVNGRNNTIKHKGLRFILAYMVYARYIGESYISDTFSGFVKKERTDSVNLNEGEILRLQNVSKKIALTEWDNIKEYLNLNYALYPKWLYAESVTPYTPKFYGLKKTKYGKESSRSVKRCDYNGKRFTE